MRDWGEGNETLIRNMKGKGMRNMVMGSWI